MHFLVKIMDMLTRSGSVDQWYFLSSFKLFSNLNFGPSETLTVPKYGRVFYWILGGILRASKWPWVEGSCISRRITHFFIWRTYSSSMTRIKCLNMEWTLSGSSLSLSRTHLLRMDLRLSLLKVETCSEGTASTMLVNLSSASTIDWRSLQLLTLYLN